MLDRIAALEEQVIALQDADAPLVQMNIELKKRITALESAAKDVVESEMNCRWTQTTHWHNPTIDILGIVLKEQGE
jgi:hypothetical protein